MTPELKGEEASWGKSQSEGTACEEAFAEWRGRGCGGNGEECVDGMDEEDSHQIEVDF